MNVLQVAEVIRANDIFLAKCKCPNCGCKVLSGFDQPWTCDQCRFCLSDVIFDVHNSDKRNLVAIPDQKRRRYISKKAILKLLDLQNRRCAYCYESFGRYEVEHIIPIAVGGTNKVNNICLACPPCNDVAASFYFKSFFAKQLFILQQRKITTAFER